MTQTTDLQLRPPDPLPPVVKATPRARLVAYLERRSLQAQRRAIVEFQSDAVEIDQTPVPWLADAAAHAQ